MIPRKFKELLNSPFHSYAGLRYNLPFLERTRFWEPSTIGPGVNSASWSIWEMPSLEDQVNAKGKQNRSIGGV